MGLVPFDVARRLMSAVMERVRSPLRRGDWRLGRRVRQLRPIVWLYRSHLQKSGLKMRGEQLAGTVRDLSGGMIDVSYVDEIGIGSVSGSIIFATRSFLADATLEELDLIWSRDNVLCADYLDWPVRPELHDAVDAYIASSVKQFEYFRRTYPEKKSFLILHHADPEIVGIQPPIDAARIGYFGELGNAKHGEVLQDDIDFIQTNNSEVPGRDWIGKLHDYNVHYSVREWRYPTPGHTPGAFKPFTKGFNAAHCRANIIVPRSESDALHFLGDDYPYLIQDDSLESVQKMIEYVRESFGGPEWQRGLEIMAEVRRKASLRSIVQQVQELVKRCSKW